ncbi:MAG: type II toxin-antitoxin system VapC family toxin [Chitinophagaceae bacterium]|nr:type II toxin-antitoxin system VapC family toxin [Chitinophagaceae bacterium]
MSGSKYLLDTNIIVYALKGLASVRPYFTIKPFVSILTEIETLGVKDLREEEFAIRQTAMEFCEIISLTPSVKARAIALKRKVKLAAPDAIIAATAIEEGLTLVTADKGFKRIKELQLILIEIE